jgi:hypothetical protein
MEKTRLRIALSIFVVMLFLFGIFNIYLAQQYPRKVTGLYFFLDQLSPGLDHLDADEVRDAFNESVYQVSYTDSPPLEFDGRVLEFGIPDKPDIRIVLVEEDTDVYFYGEARYEVRFPGGYGDIGRVEETLRKEMEKILTMLNLISFKDEMNFGDYDFVQMDDTINEFFYFAFISLVISYTFMLVFRKGELIEKLFTRKINHLEISGILMVFMGTFPTTMAIYYLILEGAGNMCMGLCLVVAVLFIAVGITQFYQKPKSGQTPTGDEPEEDEFNLHSIE